jgi:hypothetical protein
LHVLPDRVVQMQQLRELDVSGNPDLELLSLPASPSCLERLVVADNVRVSQRAIQALNLALAPALALVLTLARP